MKHLYIITLLALILSACGESNKEAAKDIQQVTDNKIVIDQNQFSSEKMELATLHKQPFTVEVKVHGMTDVPPNNKASVSTFMGGYVKHTPLLIGDQVKKGQLLVTLENTDYVELQQQYLEVAEQLHYLKSEYERQQTLFDENITSEKNFLRAESSYKSTLAMYNGLRQKLRMMHIDPSSVESGNIRSTIQIYAPISGSVTKVNVSNGSYVAPSDEIMEIVNTEHIHLELTVFEKDILKVTKGQHIVFKVPEASDSIYEAEVHLVGTSIDPTNRTVAVHGHIKNDSSLKFVTGMFVEAGIVLDTKESYALPKAAVVEIDDTNFILAVEVEQDGTYTFIKKEVNIGAQNDAYVEVLNTSDLEGVKVLSKGAFMVLSE